MDKKDEMKFATLSMTWYGWGSPIGLGIFLLCLALSVFVCAMAINKAVDAGKKGVEIDRMDRRMNVDYQKNMQMTEPAPAMP